MINDYPKTIIFTAAQSAYYRDNNGHLQRWKSGKGGDLNKNFYEGLQAHIEENDAELKILPIFGKAIKENILHRTVRNLPEVYDDWSKKTKKQNENVSLANVRVPPQNVDPAASRKHLTSEYGASLIYPHSKQRFAPTPSYKSKTPRFISTTGAVTNPNYDRDNDRGDQAFRDHAVGAIVLELLSPKDYNLRFITAQRDGKFIDLGTIYNGGKVSKKMAGVEALVAGDIHFPETDSKSIQATYEQIDYFRPKRLILHDLGNWGSISHHDLGDFVERARLLNQEKLSFEKEARQVYNGLWQLSKAVGNKRKIYVTHSNHDDFIQKYLNSDQWQTRDLWNTQFSAKVLSTLPSRDEYLNNTLKLFGKLPSNVEFLGLDDDLRVLGYQLASHGHRGVNGSKGGSAKSRESAMGKSVSGHSHAPEQFRHSYIVGTNSRRDLDYMAGSSSSAMAANFVLYENGNGQMLPIISGRWKS